jgi:hypothetical protein
MACPIGTFVVWNCSSTRRMAASSTLPCAGCALLFGVGRDLRDAGQSTGAGEGRGTNDEGKQLLLWHRA